MDFTVYKKEIENNGFTVLNNIYTKQETEDIATIIDTTDNAGDTFRKSKNLFAIRQFLKEIPDIQPLIFNEKLKTILTGIFGHNYFCIKSIYFDKPGNSNWFVAYHQDLTISVNKKTEIDNFGP